MTRLLTSVLELVDLPLAGHNYDFGGPGREQSGGHDGGAGLGMPWILAALTVLVFTAGLLVWLNPSALEKLKAIAPAAVIAVVIAAPLVAWTAYAGSNIVSDGPLMVERAVGPNDTPELLVSLGDDDLNRLETTNGKRVVRVECVGRGGEVVLSAEQKWPFFNDPGYDYPHAHQPASREQLRRADRCRLRGTRLPLEADVTGALTS